MGETITLALIINTFNQPDYLSRVLRAVSRQSVSLEEVLLADDGSADETKAVFDQWRAAQKFSCEHAWQEHQGFRRARVLNQAIALAHSEYLVFLDGDTIPHPRFVADHRALAGKSQFVQGHRALIGEKAAAWFGENNFSADRRRAILQNQISGLKNSFRWPFAFRKINHRLRGIRGCNLAIWRSDLVRVNGYNEAFVGWGREDSELAVRLKNSGVRRLDVRGRALCYHLWHPPVSRAELAGNDEILARAILEKHTRCERGLDQHR
ncbi:MAG TPA: glycosyltransferase family 2 protein [Candidatus Limnocylindrales bacterium]|nr:glycosyltransferase family 2 protein [Candidatus Limnocylindrales bacterium]